MKAHYKNFIAILAVILFTATISEAKVPGLLQRLHVGGSYLIYDIDYDIQQQYVTPDFRIDTSFTLAMDVKTSFGGIIGFYQPIARLGMKSRLAIGVDALYNMINFEHDISSPSIPEVLKLEGTSAQIALPVGLDFKFGCDAIQSKSVRFCATLGAGAMPSYSITAFEGIDGIDPEFGVAPYGKVEIGIFAGLCFKLRGIYSFGDVKMMEKITKDDFGQTTETLNSKSSITISLLIMPFSGKWQHQRWWNTY